MRKLSKERPGARGVREASRQQVTLVACRRRGHASVGWSFTVTRFLEHKRVGGCLRLCNFQRLRAQVERAAHAHLASFLPWGGQTSLWSSFQRDRSRKNPAEGSSSNCRRSCCWSHSWGGGQGREEEVGQNFPMNYSLKTSFQRHGAGLMILRPPQADCHSRTRCGNRDHVSHRQGLLQMGLPFAVPLRRPFALQMEWQNQLTVALPCLRRR